MVDDAPWIGMDREDYFERCSHPYDEGYDDYLSAKADDDYKAAQEEALLREGRNDGDDEFAI